LAEIPLSVRDVLALKPGDILSSGRRVETPAVVDLEGSPRFTARPGIVNRHKALEILSIIHTGEVPRDSSNGRGNAHVYSA
jgi:flagellar motor switch protein FliM